MPNDLRAELRFKNAVLYNALESKYSRFAKTRGGFKYGFVTVAAERIGIDYSTLYRFLTLRQSPNFKTGEFKPVALKIALDLEVHPEELFPIHLYQGTLPKMLVRDIDGSRFISLQEARKLHALPASTEDTQGTFDIGSLRKALDTSMSVLNPKEAEVLSLRFGLDGKGEHTLDEVGELVKVTRERVRQIEAKALRQLRHPSASRRIKDAAFPVRTSPSFADLKKGHRHKCPICFKRYKHNVQKCREVFERTCKDCKGRDY